MKLHFIIDLEETSVSFCPHLGVAYLSAYLKKCIPDIRISLSYLSDDIPTDVERISPDIIAISSTSRHFLRLRDIGDILTGRFRIPILWGGVHVTISPQELPDHAVAGALGEAEETLYELVNSFKDGLFVGLEQIAGIVYRKDGTFTKTAPRPFIENIDDLPFPDFQLFKVPWGRHHRGVMMTSRGCPYKCRFCASSQFWDRTRLHSAEYVVKQMEYIVEKYGVREILIFDDFFTIDKKRVERIVELKKTRPHLRKLRFECLSRIDIFEEKLAFSLREMGVYRIGFGIESGCQRTLDYLKNGKLSISQIEKAIDIAHTIHFECVGLFIIGAPFETAEEIEETFTFIQRLPLTSVQIAIATPFPGTEMWEDAKKIGKINSDVWSDDYYALFVIEHSTNLPELVKGKRLITQIEPERFNRLLDKAVWVQNRVNLTWKFWICYYIHEVIVACGLGFLLKFKQRLLG